MLYEFFNVFLFLFLHLPGFVFHLFPTLPLAKPHSVDSQTATDKIATYFRAHRTVFHLLITISLLVYTSHIFYVSSFAPFGSPSSALSLCSQPPPQPGYSLTLPANLYTKQAINSVIKNARLSFQIIFKAM